jgi:hypothetical protein
MFKPLLEPRIPIPEQYRWVPPPQATKTPKRSSQPDSSKPKKTMATIRKELKHIMHALSQAWKFQIPPPPTAKSAVLPDEKLPLLSSEEGKVSSKKCAIRKELKHIARILSQAWKCQIPPPPSATRESEALRWSDETETIKVQETKYQRDARKIGKAERGDRERGTGNYFEMCFCEMSHRWN